MNSSYSANAHLKISRTFQSRSRAVVLYWVEQPQATYAISVCVFQQHISGGRLDRFLLALQAAYQEDIKFHEEKHRAQNRTFIRRHRLIETSYFGNTKRFTANKGSLDLTIQRYHP
ncbi:hypothetical protein PGT21_018019 [Puccinia graminis f. sp. tritici]|uniref:Uncharacterized protein n=1 Tax=Puccinia graminis f. sp. tritici TaxID=56615 RepID=A0A5B0PIA2_PUCGR|nr:hypothetical protein PGT21_018019 [Puccinia graminis f. sp. tritici]